jgi:hypothetical protein
MSSVNESLLLNDAEPLSTWIEPDRSYRDGRFGFEHPYE